MSGFYTHIETETLENTFFRKVLFTGPNSQLVLMALQPNEDIGSEVHSENDQFFRFETGEGRVVIGDEEYVVKDGDSVVIPAGTEHNIINTSATEMLKMYTIYSPAHHPDGTIHQTKAEAMAAEEEENHD
jgi:mannose-6-phosphate isomerase-like protein (cupin superfamily)